METHRTLLRCECNVSYQEEVLGGFLNTSMNGFYFHLTLKEKTSHYFFSPVIGVKYYDVNEENHICRMVSMEDITGDQRTAVEVITELLRNIGVTEMAEHPQLVEKIYFKIDCLARQFESVVDKRIPIQVDILKVYGQAVIDPYNWLRREEEAEAARVVQVPSLSIEEHEFKPTPTTKTSIAALEKVKLGSEGEKCTICMKGMRKATRMPCGHMFHGDCLVKWLRINHVCPLCRFELPAQNDEGNA